MGKWKVDHGTSRSRAWWDFHTQPHAKQNGPHRVLFFFVAYKEKKTRHRIFMFNIIKIKPSIVKI